MTAGSRDHLRPNQVNQRSGHDHDQHSQPPRHFPLSRSLSLHTRFHGPTDETPDLTTKRSLLHRARRSVLSFSSPSPQASESPYASKRRRQDELHQDRPDVKRAMPSSLAYSGATRTLNENNRSHNGSLNGTHRGAEDKSSGDEGRPKNEDVFLNIARTDSGRRDSIGRSDFRRSRLGYSSQSLRSPTEQTPSPDQRYSNLDNPLHFQNDSPTAPYSATHTLASSAHPLDDPARFRYSTLSSARSAVGVPRSRFSRTSPETSPRTPSAAEELERRSSLNDPRINRHSGLSTIRSSRQTSNSEVIGRPRADTERSRADGSESTLSITAPSTVWDELDDLKDRIKKLELTGKLPASSSAAMYTPTNERPRTANTTITTLSSSPKQRRKTSISAADIEHNPAHPILQSALAKAKAVLSGEVYTCLEATITDALNLSTALGVNTSPSGSVSVVNGGYSSPERHARRKADSVCRSLTELCLALTDEQLKSARPSSSRETVVQPQLSNGAGADARMSIPTYQRNGNQEPEGVERRHSTNRMSSRLEARRSSVVNASPGNTNDIKQSPTQSPGMSSPASRLNRMPSSLRSRRLTIGEENGETGSSHSRSSSRVNTEIRTSLPAQAIPPPRQRFSQGHTVSRSISGAQQEHNGFGYSPRSPQYQPSHQYQQPSHLPQPQVQSSQPRTPTLSSSFSFRRSYMNPATYTPAISRSNIQAGSRRYGLTPSFSSNNVQGSSAEESPRSLQMEPSQTRISTPSSKVATSYTPIQTPRLRTNSLGARRFGLRNRAPATPNNANLDDSID
ncbi:hypothetical protein DTO013E5_7395 [Penicillium roqueforti]|uniref:Genomic scaffold, ProqFM164S03 n=1 Tax=Penicillium roqueforti (strain FM164) TaxID=1365484 RepID=W6QA43_PENRF|nr:hypothetical protein DTO012A1_1862 [Penicillium roqueforti]CDM33538.1 unnamed protein product [Penicillium roqueforti FM164]KAI2751171.1 hypothetical protein DTO013F2_3951 [Penicillium roqueforti]KAI2773371.1 hypothetical protein DTO012A8_2116 [Penicillium roqueforti]KAI3078872.1 hypothetical protein CBS147339_3992 [Penicillium roqueforti]